MKSLFSSFAPKLVSHETTTNELQNRRVLSMNLLFTILVFGFGILVGAHAEDEAPAKLIQAIEELSNQKKFQEAIPLGEELVTLTRKTRGEKDLETAANVERLADLYENVADYAKAEPLRQEALEIRQKVLDQDDLNTVQSLRNLAGLYERIHRYTLAEPPLRQALEIRQKRLGFEHPDVAASLNDLAVLYGMLGEYSKAEPLLKQALEIRQRLLGPKHADTATSLDNLGDLYFNKGEYAKTEPLFKEALEIRREILGSEHADTATSMNDLAELYVAKSDYHQAEPLLKQALEIRQKVLGRNHADTATSLSNLASIYCGMGEYAKAQPLYEEALEICMKAFGREDPRSATNMEALGNLYETTGEYAKAEPLFKEALEIRQKVLGREHPDTARSINDLGVLYYTIAEYSKAEPLCHEALEIRQNVLGREHPDTATSLNNLAILYDATGKFKMAEPLYEEALEIRQKLLGRDHIDTGTTLNNLAGLYQKIGDYAKAESLYQESLAIYQKVLGPDHPVTARSLGDLADLYLDEGKYAEAQPLFETALKIREKVFGRGHPETATSLDNLAQLHQNIGDFDKALALYKQALEVRENAFGTEHYYTAQSLEKIANFLVYFGRAREAEPLFIQAIEIERKVFGQKHPAMLPSLSALAAGYEETGEYAKAEAFYQEALDICRQALGRDHPFYATALNNLALLYRSMGEYAKAEPLLQEALQIYQKALGPKHRYTASALNLLALIELDLQKTEEAKRYAKLGYSADLKAFSQILSFGSEQERLAYDRQLLPYSLFARLEESDALLAAAVLHYKGIVLDSLIEDRLLAVASKDEANRKMVEEYKAKKQSLAQLMLGQTIIPSDEASQRIPELEQELENIEGKLARHTIVLGRTRRALTVTVGQVQAAIPSNTCLIEYVKFPSLEGPRIRGYLEGRYGAVIFSQEAPPHWVSLGGAGEIEKALTRYKRVVREASDDHEMVSILQQLYSQLWEPVERILPQNINAVIVSPDGQLNFLSFATLLNRDNHFISEKYSIRYVASGRDLLRDFNMTGNKNVAVLANPYYDEDLDFNSRPASSGLSTESTAEVRGAERREIEDLTFTELPGTQKESDDLLSKFRKWGWPAESFIGPQATKQALLALHGPYILHVATHGFFEPEDASSEEADLNQMLPRGVESGINKSKFFKNPMHRSGLALAGANSTIRAWVRGEAPPIEEDGILTAADVSTLDLNGTWLVTLSACDTGSGEARAGEGVVGLRRGFMEAGAQNLLMTLWAINDEFTSRIISDFYEAAYEHRDAPGALAAIQRKWLVRLRQEKGLAHAVNLAGPFIISFQGKLQDGVSQVK